MSHLIQTHLSNYSCNCACNYSLYDTVLDCGDMATSAIVVPATVSSALVSQKRMKKVVYLTGMNSYGGLKAHNKVVSLGQPVSTERCFANIVSSLKATSSHTYGRGGALSSTCDAASEIFRIAAIMNGLVLVGVAVGFVLLRIEAWLEESE